MKLTAPQENVIETEMFFKNTSISNIGGYMFFYRKMDVERLKKAMQTLMKNADALRLRIVQKDGTIMQEFVPYEQEEISVETLSEETVKAITDEWMQTPFALDGKLYDFRILQTEDKVGMYIKLHHLIADAWTMSLVVSKIMEYYEKLENGEAVEEALPSFADAITKEETYLSSSQYQKDAEYWNQKYETKPTYVSLVKEQASFDAEAGRESFVIGKEKRMQIETYCKGKNISPAVFWEALLAIYTARINQADDITLCSLVVNRSGIKEKNTVGMFNTILPLTISLDWNETFASLCSRIGTEHFQLFRHQKYPLAKIMETIRQKHEQSSLYDLMVSYQNAQMTRSDDFDYAVHWNFNGYAELNLMLNIDDISQTGELHLNFDYRKKAFTAEEVEKIYQRLLYMIEQILTKEEIRFCDIEIVTEAERKQLLFDFNDTQKEYPKEKCIYEFLEEQVQKMPNKVALSFQGKTMTYREFHEKVNALANYILSQNIQHAIIGVMAERSFEMLIAVYAIQKATCAYMPMDPHFPEERIAFMLEDSKAPLILTQKKWEDKLPKAMPKIILDTFDAEKYSKENPKVKAKPTDTAYVIYTSGSTGKPKGAQIPHHSVINRIQWMHQKYPLKESDVILQKTPYTFDVSVWELFWWSMYGGSLEILVPEGHKDPREMIETIAQGKVTHMHFVPSMLNAFLEYLHANPALVSKLKTLRYVFASGEALQSEQVKKFYQILGENHTTLHNLYGPTECTVDVSYYDCNPEHIPDSIPIGKPVDNTQLLVLDKAGKLLPIGASGELHISGVLVGKGYINREELTKQKFVKNPYYDFPTMYRTGDLARYLPDGNIEYLGRMDYQIKIRGLRVELGDIETAITKYPNIQDTVVTVVEIAGEKNLCAYFTAKENIAIEKLKKELAKTLPDYMVPTYYRQLEKMPLNANGKIDRKSLPEVTLQSDEKYVAPKDEIESEIQECVQKILKRDKMSVETDLLTAGLTSLGVVTLMTDLSALGFNIRVKDFYENRTIRDIASFLENNNQEEEAEADDEKYRDVSDIRRISVEGKENGSILVTGATGFLGVHLIQELWEKTDRKIYCFIRNPKKWERYLETYTKIPFNNDRIVPILGDLTKENLGLVEEKYQQLVDEVSDVVHSAANVSHFCSWEESKSINLVGTCNILQFAEKAMAKLHHISTMSVSGDILTKQTVDYPEFDENQLYIGQKYKDNVYAYSKYLAEKEIIKAVREMRVNASIYRLPNLTWRTTDGVFQENFEENDLYIITKVIGKIKKFPTELAKEDIAISPVDDLARAIVLLMQKEKKNNIYHLISTNSPTLETYFRTLFKIELKPMQAVYQELREKENDEEVQFVVMYLAGILDDPSKMVVKIKSEKTNAILENLGYEWSRIDEKYIKQIDIIK